MKLVELSQLDMLYKNFYVGVNELFGKLDYKEHKETKYFKLVEYVDCYRSGAVSDRDQPYRVAYSDNIPVYKNKQVEVSKEEYNKHKGKNLAKEVSVMNTYAQEYEVIKKYKKTQWKQNKLEKLFESYIHDISYIVNLIEGSKLSYFLDKEYVGSYRDNMTKALNTFIQNCWKENGYV